MKFANKFNINGEEISLTLDRKKVFALYGDSNSVSGTHNNNAPVAISSVKAALEHNNHSVKYVNPVAGAGFALNNNFKNQLPSIVDDTVTDVCVIGGTNDCEQSYENIVNGIASFITAMTNVFPNVQTFYIAFLSLNTGAGGRTVGFKSRFLSAAQSAFNLTRSSILKMVCRDVSIWASDYTYHIMSDGIHLSTDGENAIIQPISNLLLTGGELMDFIAGTITITTGTSGAVLKNDGSAIDTMSITSDYYQSRMDGSTQYFAYIKGTTTGNFFKLRIPTHFIKSTQTDWPTCICSIIDKTNNNSYTVGAGITAVTPAYTELRVYATNVPLSSNCWLELSIPPCNF